MAISEPAESGSPQHFIVKYQGKLYLTAVIDEPDTSDVRWEDPDLGQAAPRWNMEIKSASFGNINEVSFGNIKTASFGNIDPDES